MVLPNEHFGQVLFAAGPGRASAFDGVDDHFADSLASGEQLTAYDGTVSGFVGQRGRFRRAIAGVETDPLSARCFQRQNRAVRALATDGSALD